MAKPDSVFRTAQPRDKQYKISDGGGLHMLVSPVGSKTWRISYRFGGKQRTYTVGRYPEVTVKRARDELFKVRVAVDRGEDPQGTPERAQLTGASTFRAVFEEWFDQWKVEKDPTHVDRVKGRMERDALPVIGDRAIDSIAAPEILAMVRKVEERGALDIARRLRQTCDQVYRYAFASGMVTVNPASTALVDAMRPRPKVKNMARIPASEVSHFLERVRTESGCHEATALAIRLTVLTWARTGEIRMARWSEFEGDLWRVPAGRMKMDREHQVPLSRQAQAVVKRAREIARSEEWVFPHDRKDWLPASNNMMLQVCYRLGYRGRMTIHGLRGTASTWANETGSYQPDWIEMALAHVEQNSVRGAYNAAQYLPQRRAMLQDWADYLDQDDFDDLLE